MEKNDNDIDNIKNDINIIKNNINTLSLAFERHIQEHSIAYSAIQNDSVTTTVLDNSDNKSDVSTNTSSLDAYAVEDQTETIQDYDNKSIHNYLIDYSFIDENDKNKSLREIISNSHKNMHSLYRINFLEFCRCVVGLVEDVIKIFVDKKFIDIESDNDKLLQACDLLEKEYLEKKPKTLIFPKIYIPKNQYNPYKGDINDYYYSSNKKSYLSLNKLKESDVIFTLELCFVTLYGENFYKINYRRPRSAKLQTSSMVLKRPATKLASSLQPLNKEFYYLIDHARDFRNIITHNTNNREEQKKQIQVLLSKKPYLKNIEDNYDGILEAVNWLIRQIYLDIQ